MKYYSEKTKKMYETEKDLIEAEKQLVEKAKKENELNEQRKARAKEVADALEAVQVAQKKADDLLDKFLKDYGSYHTTIKTNAYHPFDSLLDMMFNL